MKCPHCEREIHVTAYAMIPEEQRITLELTRKEGLFSADTIAGVLENFDKAMKCTARDIGGKVCVFISDVRCSEQSMSIDFVVAEVRKTKP